ncbi:uncharacterized protein LOC110769948 [Prunus avium]|uniref:Uncharacterized protein LOC110769948 n=1 Tax=Prunus avium TaxID=42229 RepID=A0A6P5TRY6_PRUAV|nr:uncharacterized protein LOC110769948 [Prunus avium]
MAPPKSNPKISVSTKTKRVSNAVKPHKIAMAKRGSTRNEKASELSKLCDIAVYMTAVGADGKIDSWPENQQDLKSVALKYKNLRRGLIGQVEKGSFSAEIVEDREIGDLGFQDNCLGSKLEALNERIGNVMRKMMKMRDDGNSTFMELYKNITESSVEPDAAYQQQQKSYLNLNLDPVDLIIPKAKPNFIGQFQQEKDYLSSIHDLRVPYNGLEFDHYSVDTNDYLSLVLGDDHNDLQPQSSNYMEGLKIDGHDVVAAMPSMDATDDDIKLLLSDCDIDMMQDDVQFCVNDLIDMLLQDPQQQTHSEFKSTILDLNF